MDSTSKRSTGDSLDAAPVKPRADGETLADRFRRLGPLRPDECAVWIRAGLDCLQNVWTSGAVLGDLQLANVIFKDDEVILVGGGVGSGQVELAGDPILRELQMERRRAADLARFVDLAATVTADRYGVSSFGDSLHAALLGSTTRGASVRAAADAVRHAVDRWMSLGSVVQMLKTGPAELHAFSKRMTGSLNLPPSRAEPASRTQHRTPVYTVFPCRRTIGVGMLLGDVFVTKRLGSTVVGETFRGIDRSKLAPLQVKVFAGSAPASPGWRDMREEVARTAKLKHRGVLAVHHVGAHYDTRFFVGEFGAASLASVLESGRTFDAAECAAIAFRLCNTLAEIHAATEVIHGRLGPSNVFLADDGPKIGDFALWRLRSRETYADADADFVAPEVRGEFAVSWKSDQYALGAVLRRLLGESAKDASARNLAAVAERMTEPDPNRRYSSYTELLAELESQTAAS